MINNGLFIRCLPRDGRYICVLVSEGINILLNKIKQKFRDI